MEKLIESIKTGKYREDNKLNELLPIGLEKLGQMYAKIVAMNADSIDG